MKIENILFGNGGAYGHVIVSADVNGERIRFTTNDTKMTDSASDIDDENHEVNMQRVINILSAEWANKSTSNEFID
jgi:hypothetical protein